MKKRLIPIILLLLLTVVFCSCAKNNDQPYDVNLITNPGFEAETGETVTGWALERYDVSAPLDYYQAILKDDAPQGNNVLKIESPEYNDARFIQSVQVVPNSYYRFSAKVKTELIDERSSESGANISFLQTFCKSEFIKENSDWQEIVIYGETDKDTTETTVALRLGYYSADASGTAYFDDVSLTRIERLPEGVSALSMTTFSFSSSSDNDTDDNVKDGDSDKIQANVIITGVALFLVLVLFLLWAKNGLNFKIKDAYIIIAVALLIRLIASSLYVGFKVDIGCFTAWGNRMAEVGLTEFYSNGYFCDYPPLYMIVLGIISFITKPFELNMQEGLGLVILKLPAVICDCLAAIMIMKISKKHLGEKMAAILGIGYALLPTAIVNSAVWGQVDSILVLFMLITFHLIDEDKFGLSILTFVIGLLFKPQAVLFGPVMLLAAIREFYVIYLSYKRKDKKDANNRLLKGFGYLFTSVALFFLISLIMKNDQDIWWLVDKYMNTLGSYDYATLSSFGLMGLLKGQWVPSDQIAILGLSYGTIGTVLLVAVILITALVFLWLITRKNLMEAKWFWVLGSFMLAGAVTVSTRTHERYMFPVIIMLIMSFVRLKDVRFLFISVGYAFLNFVNTAGLLFLYEEAGVYFDKTDAVFIIGSLLTVALFIYQGYVTISLALNEKSAHTIKQEVKKTQHTATTYSKQNDTGVTKLLEKRGYRLPKVKARDIIICLIITALYACVAFTNLGDMKVPENYWYTGKSQVYAVADLGEVTEFDSISYKGKSGSFGISVSEDGNTYSEYKNISISDNSWTEITQSSKARYIKIEALTSVKLEEIVIVKDGKPLPVKETSQNIVPVDNGSGDAKNLFDNQDRFKVESQGVKTLWESGGDYIVTLERPVSLTETYAYFENGGTITLAAEASVLGNLAMEEPWSEMILLSSSSSGWAEGSGLLESDVLPPIQRIKVKNANLSKIGEILFLENGEPVGIKEITDAEGNKALDDIKNAFDEAALALEQIKATDNATWSITTLSDYVLIDFGEIKNIDRAYYYLSLCEGAFTVHYSLDGVDFSHSGATNFEKSNLYYWHPLSAQSEARYVLVTANNQFLKILELGFFETAASQNTIEIKDIYASNNDINGGKALFDEQELVSSIGATYMNSMYFDEIYHARTAYESANGLSIYEWTHPPLGKDFMAWSVSTLGMTPFAWRLAGTMAGVLMIPAIFFLAFLMFRKTAWATVAALLMALDGMHFVQTRIATIDSYGVLFIILMFLFMYWYYSISFYDTPLIKTFLPLGLCGLSFGLGAASKWICLYAGAGLAVIFFMTLFKRWQEYSVAKKSISKATGETKKYLQHIIDSFTVNACYTILFCILVFIIIPVIIYAASYYPYWNAAGETRPWYQIILQNQKDMFSYHSQLEATHGYQSDWYTWPVMYLPMFYYLGPSDAENMSAIYAFGNPMVWYSGLVCTLMGIYIFVKRFMGGTVTVNPLNKNQPGFLKLFTADDEDALDLTKRDTGTLLFLILALATNLLPWVGVDRCIFIYHYFASVPFIILFTVYILRHFSRKNLKWGGIITIAVCVIALILFIMFKPLYTGTSVSRDYVEHFLRWLPSWFAYWFQN